MSTATGDESRQIAQCESDRTTLPRAGWVLKERKTAVMADGSAVVEELKPANSQPYLSLSLFMSLTELTKLVQ